MSGLKFTLTHHSSFPKAARPPDVHPQPLRRRKDESSALPLASSPPLSAMGRCRRSPTCSPAPGRRDSRRCGQDFTLPQSTDLFHTLEHSFLLEHCECEMKMRWRCEKKMRCEMKIRCEMKLRCVVGTSELKTNDALKKMDENVGNFGWHWPMA